MPSSSFLTALKLCKTRTSSAPESYLLKRLEIILNPDPNVAHETDDLGLTLLHYAATYRTVKFCKLLIDQNPEAVRVIDNQGSLPFHYSCCEVNTETSEYLFQIYPQCINVADRHGKYPIHCLLGGVHVKNISKLTQLLLKYDQGAVKKLGPSGQLPLHMAIQLYRGMDIMKLIFDAYPEAIYVKSIDFREETPLQLVQRRGLGEEVASFFDYQLYFVRLSEEHAAQDENGEFFMHSGLNRGLLSLGTIKLMVKANPAIINVADNRGNTPLKIAVNHGDNEIAKYLIKVDVECLSRSDWRGNFLLHHACLAGNCNIVNFILETSDHGASVRNFKGKLPIQLLLYDADCNRDIIEFVSAIHFLLLAYPNVKDIAL